MIPESNTMSLALVPTAHRTMPIRVLPTTTRAVGLWTKADSVTSFDDFSYGTMGIAR